MNINGEATENAKSIAYLGSEITWDNDILERRSMKDSVGNCGFQSTCKETELTIEVKILPLDTYWMPYYYSPYAS